MDIEYWNDAPSLYLPRPMRKKAGVVKTLVVVIDDEIYMMYTAYDGVIAQIGGFQG